MFRALLYKPVVSNMSQSLISSFFKSPQGVKRKQNDDNKEPELPGDAKRQNKSEPVSSADRELRTRIIAMSKENPALSANIGLSWFKALSEEFEKDYFKELGEFLKRERNNYTIFPPEEDVYKWTNAVKITDVKVIILGQDPYHGPRQAHGLAFSVRKGVTVPPSLRNIYKELTKDIPGFQTPNHGCLFGWAAQGVLLLNATLTVRSGHANSHSAPSSHKNAKWSYFTDAVIKWIDQNLPNSVFILWGKNAQEKMSMITKGKHLILTAPHPSPFSADRGFFGCRHFSKANEYLKKHDKKTIDWNNLP